MNSDVWQYILNIFFSSCNNYSLLTYRERINRKEHGIYNNRISPYQCRYVCKVWNDLLIKGIICIEKLRVNVIVKNNISRFLTVFPNIKFVIIKTINKFDHPGIVLNHNTKHITWQRGREIELCVDIIEKIKNKELGYFSYYLCNKFCSTSWLFSYY